MTTASRPALKLAGAAGVAALVMGAVVVPAPAVAAPVTIDFHCAAGIAPLSITMDLGALPTSMVAGQTVTQSIQGGVLHLPNQTVKVLTAPPAPPYNGAVGYDNLGATVVSNTGTPFSMTVPATDLPHINDALANPNLTVDIPATGAFTLKATAAGPLNVVAGSVAPTLLGSIAGKAQAPFPISCNAPTDGSQNLGSVNVVKDASTMATPSAAYRATTRVATLTAGVKGATYGLTGTGNLTFVVKAGRKTVKTVVGELQNGVATVSFKAPKNPTKKKHVKKPGKKHGKKHVKKVPVPVTYTVSVSYAGDAALAGSAGTTTFTVRK